MSSGNVARAAFSLLVAALLSFSAARAQNQDSKLLSDKPKPAAKTETGQKRERPITVDVNLVLVNVSVVDPLGRLVVGLEKENFRIIEGDKEQKILHLSMEDLPASLGLVFDASGSMSNKQQNSYRAAVEFLKVANPDDEFMLINFSNEPHLVASFTSDVEKIGQDLMFLQPKGSTALLDALYLATSQMRHARHQRKAILIVSDGGDNHSRYNLRDVRELVKESDVQIYSIGIFGGAATPEEVSGPSMMRALAEMTGGRAFAVGQGYAADIAAKIGTELRNEYILAYRPENEAKDGKWRKVTVKVVPPRGLPPLKVYSKRGYYAPAQ